MATSKRKVIVGIGSVIAVLFLANKPALAAGADVRLADAASQRDTATIRALLKKGVDVNVSQADGATALQWLVHWNDLEGVNLLLQARANANLANDHGVTPLGLACENGNGAIVERLLGADADPNAAQTNGVTPLMIAARGGSLDIVKALLGRDAKVNASTKTQQTALMWATAERHVDVVRALVTAGADVHAASSIGFTPLLFAARNGDIEAAKVLLDAGAGVNETGSDGTHALPLAIVSGHDAFAMFLLERGADSNGVMFGVSALHAASGQVDRWLREWVRARGADNSSGVPLVTLDRGQRLQLVKDLLHRGAKVNARITTSATAQGYITTRKGAFDTFALGTGDMKGATPLWVAAWSLKRIPYQVAAPQDLEVDGIEILRTLLEAGADVRIASADGTTPLMVAAGIGRSSATPEGQKRGPRSLITEAAVKLLVDAGADVNAVNEANFTALHGAAYNGNNELIEYLVAQGAKMNIQDFRGRTPFRLAEGSKQSFGWREFPDTAELFRKLGADTTLGVEGRVLERQVQRDVAQQGGGTGTAKKP
jgi:ankyrin repeat protein